MSENGKNILTAVAFSNPLRNQQVEVVSTVEECKQVLQKIKSHADDYKVLGFDCEWVNINGKRQSVALLQLASQHGLCALIRLRQLKRVPKELKELLEDEGILKVGVACRDDGKLLMNDYGVNVKSTFDLRYLADYADHEPCGLARLSSSLLNVKLNKDYRIRCSNWEAATLSKEQIQYAANDAHVAIEIFKKLIDKEIGNGSPNSNFDTIMHFCKSNTDRKYKTKVSSSGKKAKRILEISNAAGKPYREHSTRRSVLYHNCFLLAPNNELLCSCDRKKAEWYVSKELGVKVKDEPLTVRLNFEPAGYAVGDVGQYYTQIKENQCVVCGHTEKYIRKNVVPREYRKLFPEVMKEHTSHDVLLLCPSCHQRSNSSDMNMRMQLEELCDAPLASNCRTNFIKEQAQIKSAARALLQTKTNIPEKRKEALRSIVLNYFPGELELTDEMLKEASSVSVMEINENYESHGRKVVEYFSTKRESGGLTELEKLWREHFLHHMNPQFMPKLWSVSHNANSNKKFKRFCNNQLENEICNGLLIRADEDRVNAEDLEIAGVKQKIPASNINDV